MSNTSFNPSHMIAHKEFGRILEVARTLKGVKESSRWIISGGIFNRLISYETTKNPVFKGGDVDVFIEQYDPWDKGYITEPKHFNYKTKLDDITFNLISCQNCLYRLNRFDFLHNMIYYCSESNDIKNTSYFSHIFEKRLEINHMILNYPYRNFIKRYQKALNYGYKPKSKESYKLITNYLSQCFKTGRVYIPIY